MAGRLSVIGGHVVGECRVASASRGAATAASTAAATSPAAVAAARSQIVVVTGCTSGLGLSLCHEFIRLGHTVAGCGRRAATIDALNKEYAGGASSFHTADVTDLGQMEAFAKEVEERYSDIDVLICNAGLPGAGKASWDIPPQHLSNIVDVSVKGVMYTNRLFVPVMIRGLEKSTDTPVKRVINISSGVGHTSIPGAADYCSVKFAVEGWSKCVAQEFKMGGQQQQKFKDRILCVPLAPGVVRTEMQRSEKVPPADVWCKDAAPFILNIPPSENGSSLIVPGYYSEKYMSAWVVPAGAKMNDKVVPPTD